MPSEQSFYRDGLQFISSRPLEADRQQFCLVRSSRLSVASTMVGGTGIRSDGIGPAALSSVRGRTGVNIVFSP
jgi:hypothetical protein